VNTLFCEANPVVAVTVNVDDPTVGSVGAPVRSPVEESVSPLGILALLKEETGRSERVVAENWIGVIVRFWTKLSRDDETSEMVMTSFTTERLISRVAVAGVPVALAVTVTVVRGVIVSGIPTS
jgi:hypothetical protein